MSTALTSPAAAAPAAAAMDRADAVRRARVSGSLTDAGRAATRGPLAHGQGGNALALPDHGRATNPATAEWQHAALLERRRKLSPPSPTSPHVAKTVAPKPLIGNE